MATQKNHYLLLDAVRGLAAFAVFFYHLNMMIYGSQFFGETLFLSKSYLAVDLFFLMSGLVIAQAYEKKLLTHVMTFLDFVWVRFIRLYPLYILGLALGVGQFAVKVMITPDVPFVLGDTLRALTLNILFLPDVLSQKELFIFNVPSWSLLLEWAINLLYAACVIHLSTRVLVLIMAFSVPALVIAAFYYNGLGAGYSMDTFLGGTARIFFSFTLGVLLYRLILVKKMNIPISAYILLAAISVILIMPIEKTVVLYDLTVVMIVFPIFVFMACMSRVPDVLKRPSRILGDLSYPLYILHVPLILWASGIWKVGMKSDPVEHPFISAIIITTFVLTTSFVAMKLFDKPVRDILHKMFLRKNNTNNQ